MPKFDFLLMAFFARLMRLWVRYNSLLRSARLTHTLNCLRRFSYLTLKPSRVLLAKRPRFSTIFSLLSWRDSRIIWMTSWSCWGALSLPIFVTRLLQAIQRLLEPLCMPLHIEQGLESFVALSAGLILRLGMSFSTVKVFNLFNQL